MTARVVGLFGTVVLVVTTAAIPLQEYAAGLEDTANHPLIVVPMAIAVLAVALAAAALRHPTHARTQRGLIGIAVALYLYLMSTAALAWYGGHLAHRDLGTQWLVAAQAVGWVPPITMLTLTLLGALRDVGVAGAGVRRLAAALGGYTTVMVVVAFLGLGPAPDSPYAALPPIWDDPRISTLATVLVMPWMLSVLVPPVVAWRAVGRAPAERRGQVLDLALAAMVPPVTIVFCLAVTLLGYVAGVLSLEAGATSLSLAFHLPFIVAGPAITYALRAGATGISHRRVAQAIGVTIGAPLVVTVGALAWWLAAGLGSRGVAFAVAGTLALGALAAAVRRWSVRALVIRMDPARARAAALLEAGVDDGTTPAAALGHVVREALQCPDATVVVRLDQDRWATLDGTDTAPPVEPTISDAHVEPSSADAAAVLREAGPLLSRAILELSVRDRDARMAAAAAEERRRLERDLHDGVQGRLLAIALDLRVAQHALPDGEAHLVIADAVDALREAIEELRNLSHGSGPELLSRRGLRTALADFAARMPRSVTLLRSPERLSPSAESVIYLAVCEGVTNAVKHAAAQAIEVDVSADGSMARAVVIDDGVGGADLRAGTGLRGLAERVAAAGGVLIVSDRQPHGTLLEVSVPCES